MNHVLAGLGDGAGDPGAQDEGVQAHLEQLDEGLTGQALAATGLLEDSLELGLADTVLGAQALLLLEADGVVGLGAAAGAAVLTGAVGAALEVAARPWGVSGDAEGRVTDAPGDGSVKSSCVSFLSDR